MIKKPYYKKTFGNVRWVLFIAVRSFSKKKSKVSASSLLSVFEIGAGVLALTVIIAVMNGFQLGFIESILEVSSYYVRVDNFPAEKLERSGGEPYIIDEIKKLPGVLSVTPFIESQGIVQGLVEGDHPAVLLRGIPPDTLREDAGMNKHLEFVMGGFDLEEPHSILLGVELASRLFAGVGDKIQFLSIAGFFPLSETSDGSAQEFTVTGVFRTGYYEYDSSWGFINIGDSKNNDDDTARYTLGIKLNNRYNDIPAAAQIECALGNLLPRETFEAEPVRVSSWRDYNKSFFNALRTEKILMFFLVGLIFIVVGFNIYQAQRRTILEQREDIGLLRAIGAQDFLVRSSFALRGLIIGFTGASGGMILALFISLHIQKCFSFFEAVISFILSVGNWIAHGILYGDDFAVFSKKIFYIQEYTARLIPHEVFFIYFFAVFSAFFAAWFASRRVIKIRPADVLRYE